MHRICGSIAILLFTLLLCAVPFLNAVIYEPDDYPFADTQLTLTAEEDEPPCRPGFGPALSQNGKTSDSTTLDPLEELRQAVNVMQSTWFKLWVGTWPTAIDWTRAVLNTHIISTLSMLSRALEKDEDLPKIQSSGDIDSTQLENEINQYFAQNVSL